MFKKLMASFGVGAARINLVLDKEQCHIGEHLTGKVVVEGGSVNQKINTLDIDVVIKFNVRGKEFTRVIETIRITQDFQIDARETRELPFQHHLPMHYPISKGSVAYYLQTKMDIAQAVDTSDQDKFFVLPSGEMQLVFDALQAIGFKEKISSGKIEQYGQEFEFYPSPKYEDQLQEMELKFYFTEHELKLFFELEMAGGYMRSGIEHHTELALPSELLASGSVQAIASKIEGFLDDELHLASVQGPRMAPSYNNYGYASHGSPFGGFIGGMITGMLGGALLSEIFSNDEIDEQGESMGEVDDAGEGGFDLGLGDFFGDDDF